jgi:hypothetical protein
MGDRPEGLIQKEEEEEVHSVENVPGGQRVPFSPEVAFRLKITGTLYLTRPFRK